MNVAITPAARREAEHRKIDIRQIRPTGVSGYVQLVDVQLAGAQPDAGKRRRITALALEIARQNGISALEITARDGERITKADVLERIDRVNSAQEIPHTKMRSVIANRMAKSMAEVPQYTIFGEYDATSIFEGMLKYAEFMRDNGDVKPTFSDIILFLTAHALRNNEILNSTFLSDRVVIHPDINIGLAVAMEDGLVVPNIKQADRKTLRQISRERAALVQKARAGRLLPDDYAGGTFTITNLGQYPVQFSTPIINQPESAILGIGSLMEKPIIADGQIVIRKMIGVSLTSDHRHIDGARAARFLSDFKRLLEQSITNEQMCNIPAKY